MIKGWLKPHIAAPYLIALWLLLLVPILFLTLIPTSVAVQGLFAMITLGALIVFRPFVRVNLPIRFVALAVASAYTLRYWLWRLTETLPPLEEPLSFTAAIILFSAETFTVGLFFLTALINADPTRPDAPLRVRLRDVPTVDILVPSYNEPIDMLAVTLAAARQITYPEGRKKVVLCDDGGTDQRCNHSDPVIAKGAQTRRARLQRLCEEMGVVYTTRARNEKAKAGNLNAALKNLDGELFLVLDADHVPTRDFLARTVGFFVENPRLFLVQTPHFFTNRDPIERNLALPETCPSENEMFYSTIHAGLDRLGGAFFCGSAALLRRRAVDEVGGISGETITEDAETALDIHARGWESKYLDHAMIAGLQPETFASFIQQRGRWATGMTQMLILKNPLFRSGLKLAQRLCYVNSMSFWLFPLMRIVFLISPLFYLFFGFKIFVVSFPEVLVYILPYLLVGFLIQNALFARVRWPQISEVYEIAQTPYLFRAIFATILRPRAASFQVTAKDEDLKEAFMSPIFLPLLGLALLILAGFFAAVLRWLAFPGDRLVVQVVGGWNLYNLLLVSLALRSVFERPRRMMKPRTSIEVPATIVSEQIKGSVVATVIAADAKSVQLQLEPGARSTAGEDPLVILRDGTEITIQSQLPGTPFDQRPLKGKVEALLNESQGAVLSVAIHEDDMIEASKFSAFTVYGNSARWVHFRKIQPRSRGLVPGLVYVLRKGVVSIPMNAWDFLREPARRSYRGEVDTTVPGRVSTSPRAPTAPQTSQKADDDKYLEIEE